jgi:Zn-finger domain-containing protein
METYWAAYLNQLGSKCENISKPDLLKGFFYFLEGCGALAVGGEGAEKIWSLEEQNKILRDSICQLIESIDSVNEALVSVKCALAELNLDYNLE